MKREKERGYEKCVPDPTTERLDSARAGPPRTCDYRPRTLPFTITFSIALLHRHSRNEARVPLSLVTSRETYSSPRKNTSASNKSSLACFAEVERFTGSLIARRNLNCVRTARMEQVRLSMMQILLLRFFLQTFLFPQSSFFHAF